MGFLSSAAVVIPWRKDIKWVFSCQSFFAQAGDEVYRVDRNRVGRWERVRPFHAELQLPEEMGLQYARALGFVVEQSPEAKLELDAVRDVMDKHISASLARVNAITDAELIKRIGTALDPHIRQVVREEMAKTLPSSDVVERDCKGLLEAVVNAPTHTQHDNAMTAAASALTAARTNGGGK